VEGIEDRTDTRGSMRKFVAMQEMDGATLARLHHIQWCWQLRMGVQREVIGGRWWLGNGSLDHVARERAYFRSVIRTSPAATCSVYLYVCAVKRDARLRIAEHRGGEPVLR
jgi:hypothetical protein